MGMLDELLRPEVQKHWSSNHRKWKVYHWTTFWPFKHSDLCSFSEFKDEIVLKHYTASETLFSSKSDAADASRARINPRHTNSKDLDSLLRSRVSGAEGKKAIHVPAASLQFRKCKVIFQGHLWPRSLLLDLYVPHQYSSEPLGPCFTIQKTKPMASVIRLCGYC